MDLATDNACNIEHETLVERYGEETMYAGWNPQLPLIGDSLLTPFNRHVNLLADLVSVDAEVFLKKMYECQC